MKKFVAITQTKYGYILEYPEAETMGEAKTKTENEIIMISEYNENNYKFSVEMLNDLNTDEEFGQEPEAWVGGFADNH